MVQAWSHPSPVHGRISALRIVSSSTALVCNAIPPAAYSNAAEATPPSSAIVAEIQTGSDSVGATGTCSTPEMTGGWLDAAEKTFPRALMRTAYSEPPSVVMNRNCRCAPPNSTLVGRSGTAIRSTSVPAALKTRTASSQQYRFPSASIVMPSQRTDANCVFPVSEPSGWMA